MTPVELRAARKRRGLTQAAFAAACGVDERTVRRWEAGDWPIPEPVAALVAAGDSDDDASLVATIRQFWRGRDPVAPPP